MVHGERAAARQRWLLRLADVGLIDALASVLANLEVEGSAPPLAPAAAAGAAADATFAIVARLLGEGGGGPPTPRRQPSQAAAQGGGGPLTPRRQPSQSAPPPPLGVLLSKVGRCRVGLLIDLDGTLYSPLGLLPGARCLYERLVAACIPFVLLSNTGAKARHGVAAKLRAPPFLLPGPPLDAARHIWTAADAQVAWMVDTLPPHALVFVISGASQPFWHAMLLAAAPELVRSWTVRTSLSEAEAKRWAARATCAGAEHAVSVALFLDGNLASSVDPTTGEAGYTDWSFDMVKKASYLLMHGASFIYTADDAFNPSVDPEYPDMVWPLPGPGMFAAMMRKVMYPRGIHRAYCVGKGGAAGCRYMMGAALQMLRDQGHSGERAHVLMLGDRFDTDVRAGVQAGVRTCLVQSGCHLASEQRHFPADTPDYVVGSIREIAALLPRAPAPSVAALAGASAQSSEAAGRALPAARPLPTSAPPPPPPKPLRTASAFALPASLALAGAAGGAGVGDGWAPVLRQRSMTAPDLVERSALSASAERAPALQRWMLMHGNSAAAAGGGGGGRGAAGPLFPVLRRHFEAHPEVRATGALSAAGLLDAMAALGLGVDELRAAAHRLAADGLEAVDFRRFFREIRAPLSRCVGDDVLVGVGGAQRLGWRPLAGSGGAEQAARAGDGPPGGDSPSAQPALRPSRLAPAESAMTRNAMSESSLVAYGRLLGVRGDDDDDDDERSGHIRVPVGAAVVEPIDGLCVGVSRELSSHAAELRAASDPVLARSAAAAEAAAAAAERRAEPEEGGWHDAPS